MKNSIYQVPISGDFIDLEHLISIGTLNSYSNKYISIKLKYQLHKEDVEILVKQDDLISWEKFIEENETLNQKPNSQILDSSGKGYYPSVLEKAEELVRLKIFEAWNNYRTGKEK